ncbi:MAG: hypothetical protein L6Q53_06775 [Candidatus Brocadia sinica]|nr:hypothetical protein [Candidatus Brocadia sinica]
MNQLYFVCQKKVTNIGRGIMIITKDVSIDKEYLHFLIIAAFPQRTTKIIR